MSKQFDAKRLVLKAHPTDRAAGIELFLEIVGVSAGDFEYEEKKTPEQYVYGDQPDDLGWPGPDAMRVIDPDQWEPCSPAWIEAGGDCSSAPRVWNEADRNHWHPKHKAVDPTEYLIGDRTMAAVFVPAGLKNLSDLQAVFDAVEKALTPSAPDDVQVKSLEWRGLEAHSSVGLYRVQRLGDKWEPLHLGAYMLPKIHGVVAALDTLEEAQAVAQADYESRIRSAVVAPTPPVSREQL